MTNNLSKDVFERIMEMSDDGFIVVDCNGIIMEINQNYCEFLNASKEEAVGKSILKFIPNSKMLDIMRDRYSEEGVIHQYVSGTTKERSVIVSRTYIEDECGNVVAGVAQVKFRIESLEVAQKLMNDYVELEYYKEQYHHLSHKNCNFDEIVGSSKIFISKKIEAMKAAKTDFPVLLTGETGTGKEIFAKAIHNFSRRADRPVIAINCAAIPYELLESELFGYEEGAFTGAKKGGKKGKFLIANEGTLFLDEIGDMPLPMQGKLLRVLQENEIEPIGSLHSVPIDVRIIAATRRNLVEMVEAGTFREDLYYRLNVINITMPTLKERKQDILELSNYFLRCLNESYNTKKVFSREVECCFLAYDWPGNIRELDNVVKSAYAISDGFIIQIRDLPSKLIVLQRFETGEPCFKKTLKSLVDDFERQIILDTLTKEKYNCSRTAQALGMHRSLLYKKVNKYGIMKPVDACEELESESDA